MYTCVCAHTLLCIHTLSYAHPNFISVPVRPPPPPLTGQPTINVHPQPLTFSKDMSYEQLAVWLTNHPQFVGADYQEDISKLKGTYLL